MQKLCICLLALLWSCAGKPTQQATSAKAPCIQIVAALVHQAPSKEKALALKLKKLQQDLHQADKILSKKKLSP